MINFQKTKFENAQILLKLFNNRNDFIIFFISPIKIDEEKNSTFSFFFYKIELGGMQKKKNV